MGVKTYYTTQQIDQAVLGTTLDVTAIETPSVGPSKVMNERRRHKTLNRINRTLLPTKAITHTIE